MQKTHKGYLVSLFALLVLLVSALVPTFVYVKNHAGAVAATNATTSATPATARMVAKHTVNMATIPAARSKPLKQSPGADPWINVVSPAAYAQLKAVAANNRNAPVTSFVQRSTALSPLALSPSTPGLTTGFQGMAKSSTTCPAWSTCKAPDEALAASPNWVLQGVHASFAVYSPTGQLRAGWPKNFQTFFGIPNPPGGCDPNGPFLVNPRAFYDSNDGRFWVAIIQDEDAFGVGTNCPFQALYWIAVSQTNDPNGSWNVYSFDMANGTQNAVDYTQFGFDAQAIYFVGNMWNQAVTKFQYTEVFAANKSLMESGSSVTPHGFFNLQLNGVSVDTVQPVETEARSYSGPPVGLFVNSLDYNFGGHMCSTACNGLVVWALANPTSANPSLTSVLVNTTTYTLAPEADQPGCTLCVETNGPKISATPVYRSGLISFALETGVNNGTQVVPGIFWGQISPVLSSTGTITGASMFQSGYFNFQGDTAASCGAVMPDEDGNLFMVFEEMSSSIFPQVSYVARRVTFTAGLFPDGGVTLRAGDARSFGTSRWGDFNATSYDGVATDNVWFAGEYAASNGSWSTYIGTSHFTLASA
jgi:hypothetical protein